MLSSRMATKVELDTVLSVEDVYDILEVLTVDRINKEALDGIRS